MPRLLRNQRVDLPNYAPTARRPIRLVARDVDHDVRFPEHEHRWHQVLYAAVGALRVSTRDTTWIVPATRAIWIPTGVRHAVQVIDDAQMRSLYVLPAASTRVGGGAGSVDPCRVIEVTPLLRDLIADLHTDRTERDAGRERLVGDLILDELATAETLPVGIERPADKRLVALCDALIADPGSDRSLDEWAPRVGASARTLARLFADELGTTFGAWRQRMRIAHAAPLIARGWPLARVANALGYGSQSAFSAMFKRTFGKSPSAFFATRRR